ncbi:MAG TPA: hypothetical protein VD838_01640 [Anaeromyxobacteraceae bacterium]|nr:hypothetical protein [Anaeromyxobacteraceae bacterium]
MIRGRDGRKLRFPRTVEELLAFRPWMLALAVLLGCALGVAVMEELRGPSVMWAQATPQSARSR